MFYLLFCLYNFFFNSIRGMGTDMLLTNIIFSNIMSFLLFLPIAIFMQICCIRFDSILAKILPNILLILIVLTRFRVTGIYLYLYYTAIQSTTSLGIKLLVYIWIMGFGFSLLPKLIKLKEQNLV